jgi:hypothetical protein
MDSKKKELKIAEITNKFLLHLKETTDCLTHIYNAVNKLDTGIDKPLPTDSFPLVVNDNKPKLTINDQKQITLNWVLTKAFEDFIGGLSISFKETYKCLKIYTISLEPHYTITHEFKKELKKIETEIEKFSFPDFMENIEKLLQQSLPLKEEILSINKLRNCLVHRNGVVGEKDVKNSLTNDLRLKWISIKFWTEKNGQQEEINFMFRKDKVTVNNLSYKPIKNEKIFKVGDKVELDINEFNGIAFTCLSFANNLFPLMPHPGSA